MCLGQKLCLCDLVWFKIEIASGHDLAPGGLCKPGDKAEEFWVCAFEAHLVPIATDYGKVTEARYSDLPGGGSLVAKVRSMRARSA